MKARFTPLIENKVEAGILAIAGSSTMDNSSHRSSSTDSDSPFPLLPAPTDNSLSDPDELKVLIKSLISNIPSHGPKSASPNSSAVARDDSQYYKLQLAAKGMPPASVHAKMGINMKAKEDKRHDRKEEILNAPVSAVQNRPSVLRGPCITMRANERGGGVLVTTKRMREEDVLFKPINATRLVQSKYPVGSDIELFQEKNIPGVALLNDNAKYFWYHHSRADTMSVLDSDTLDLCTALWGGVAYILADLSVELPRT
ncbi:hypothetical protein M8J75_005980 [Diaphorina citri]|nr:hypothetical protein M8J75_005980 [Diaphorina citri]